MKKQLKSLVAIVIALSLGFTSCKNDDPIPSPEPEPEPTVKVGFNNEMMISSEIFEYFDVTMEFTNTEGKVTSQDFTKCPVEKIKLLSGKEFTVYKFKEFETIISPKLPLQTSFKAKYVVKDGVVPPFVIAQCYIQPQFYVGYAGGEPKGFGFGINYGDVNIKDEATLQKLLNTFNNTLGSVVMMIEANGNLVVK